MSTPPPLPAGFTITLDPRLKRIDRATLFGGAPARVFRLSHLGEAALREIEAGPVTSAAGRVLARRLTDAGMAHPRPPADRPASVTVVIPVYGRADELDRCLGALGREHSVVVVDDGSADPSSISTVAERHGARLVSRTTNGGPAAARNEGLAAADTELVAFLDSDCIPTPGWVEALVAHLSDPLVAAAAPRIVPSTTDTSIGRYSQVRSSLDLGSSQARVVPITAVPYVPTAALVVRRAALLEVSRDGRVFDPTLRFGEDVDLVWRLHRAGWRIRYDPSVLVGHREPKTLRALLARRFRYGTSAAPLALRHPDYSAPVVIAPWPALAAGFVAARRPMVAATCCGATALSILRSLDSARLPSAEVPPATAKAIGHMWLGLGRYVTQTGAPMLTAYALTRVTARRGSKLLPGLLAMAITPGLLTWGQRRPQLDLFRTVLTQLADDGAYGCGVWAGCMRERTLAPLRPRWWR